MRAGRPIIYDITRLVLRLARPVPNGIDRVDLMLATLLLRGPEDMGLLMTPLGPRLIAGGPARRILAHLAKSWEGDVSGDSALLFEKLVARLSGARAEPRFHMTPRIASAIAAAPTHLAELVGHPIRHAPADALYVNVSQFPLWIDGCYRWLQARRIPGLFFIHDLLPLQLPHHFPRGEERRHARRLDTVARRASGALVASPEVAMALRDHMGALGRNELPIKVVPLPVASEFLRRTAPPPALEGVAYFVVCGTIEPRKNHLLVLQIWRDLARRLGAATPTLVLVGVRGWKNDQVYELIAGAPDLRRHIVEVNGLANLHLRALLAGARALLIPSFAEGYGLPLYEALTSGVTVLASDIAAFRHVRAEGLTRLDPADHESWRGAIETLARAPRPSPAPPQLPRLEDFGRAVEGFIATLAPVGGGKPRA